MSLIMLCSLWSMASGHCPDGLGPWKPPRTIHCYHPLQVLSDQLYKAGSQYRKIAHDSSRKRARSPVDHDPGKIDMLDPNSSDNIDNLEDANRIILALKLQNSELKKSLETARQEKDKSQDHFGKQMQKLSAELSKKCNHAQEVILNLLQTGDDNDA